MTITFRCPKCQTLCAFDVQYAGRRARCNTCNLLFIIPAVSGQEPKLYDPPADEPVSGYYRAVFVQSWRMFVNPANVTGFVFIAAIVCLKFFVGHADYSFTLPGLRIQLPIGQVATVITWGLLAWYFMELIHTTMLDDDELPVVEFGGGFAFFGIVIKSIYFFVVAIIIVELPFLILIGILEAAPFKLPELVRLLLLVVGIFAFPMAILTLAAGRQIYMVFWPPYIVGPIIKAFRPYFVSAALVMAAGLFNIKTVDYGSLLGRSRVVVAMHLLVNFGSIAFTMIAMRSIGLFCRHYSCFLPQITEPFQDAKA